MTMNNFANCILTEDKIRFFLSRQIGKELLHNLLLKANHLFCSECINSVLNALTTEGYKFTAIDFLAGDIGGKLTDMLGESPKQLKVSDTLGLPYELFF